MKDAGPKAEAKEQGHMRALTICNQEAGLWSGPVMVDFAPCRHCRMALSHSGHFLPV